MTLLAYGEAGAQTLDTATPTVSVNVELDAPPPAGSVVVSVSQVIGANTVAHGETGASNTEDNLPDGYTIVQDLHEGNSARSTLVCLRIAGEDEDDIEGPFWGRSSSTDPTADVGIKVMVAVFDASALDQLGALYNTSGTGGDMAGVDAVAGATLVQVGHVVAANRAITHDEAMTPIGAVAAGTFGLQDAGTLSFAYEVLEAAGETGTRSWSVAGGSTTLRGVMFTLAPSEEPPEVGASRSPSLPTLPSVAP